MNASPVIYIEHLRALNHFPRGFPKYLHILNESVEDLSGRAKWLPQMILHDAYQFHWEKKMFQR